MVITAGESFLRCGKQHGFNKWEKKMKMVSYEKPLAWINDNTDNFDKPWGQIFDLDGCG